MDSAGSHSGWFSGFAAAATGLGVVTFAFFPFALPLLVLTVAATLPLVLPLVVLGVVAAILTGTWRGVRAAGRRARRLGASPNRPASPVRHVVGSATWPTHPRRRPT